MVVAWESQCHLLHRIMHVQLLMFAVVPSLWKWRNATLENGKVRSWWLVPFCKSESHSYQVLTVLPGIYQVSYVVLSLLAWTSPVWETSRALLERRLQQQRMMACWIGRYACERTSSWKISRSLIFTMGKRELVDPRPTPWQLRCWGGSWTEYVHGALKEYHL